MYLENYYIRQLNESVVFFHQHLLVLRVKELKNEAEVLLGDTERAEDKYRI